MLRSLARTAVPKDDVMSIEVDEIRDARLRSGDAEETLRVLPASAPRRDFRAADDRGAGFPGLIDQALSQGWESDFGCGSYPLGLHGREKRLNDVTDGLQPDLRCSP